MINRSIENRCKICREVKELAKFRECFQNRRGAVCIVCENEFENASGKTGPYAKKCGHCEIVKPYDQFPIDSRELSGRYTSCKECCSKKGKESQGRHPNSNKFRKLRDRYGLTPTEYFELPQFCSICKREDVRLNVDHSHTTGRVRALLCTNCNTGLGMFKENIDCLTNAIEYVKRFNYE